MQNSKSCGTILLDVSFDIFKEVYLKWLNVKFAVRVLLSVSRYHTHTEDQTEPGSLMSEESELSLTAIQSQSIFVLVACVPERLHAQFDFMNLTEEQRRSSVFFMQIF